MLDPRKQPSSSTHLAPSSIYTYTYTYNSMKYTNGSAENIEVSESCVTDSSLRIRPTRSPFYRGVSKELIPGRDIEVHAIRLPTMLFPIANEFILLSSVRRRIITARAPRTRGGFEEGYCCWPTRVIVWGGIGCLETVRWIVESVLAVGILSLVYRIRVPIWSWLLMDRAVLMDVNQRYRSS